jgi:GNAT superfamily N-acetyltransferase
MTAHFRRATPADAPALLTVRAATRENPFSIEALAAIGVTADSVASGLEAGTLAGWVAEVERATIAGFCLADVPGGELWVLAVLPSHEGRGFGRELLARTEQLVWDAGHSSAWLWTSPDPSLRARKIYLAAGWQDSEVRDGQLFMRKHLPEGRGESSATLLR